jgi:hypothetical protein
VPKRGFPGPKYGACAVFKGLAGKGFSANPRHGADLTQIAKVWQFGENPVNRAYPANNQLYPQFFGTFPVVKYTPPKSPVLPVIFGDFGLKNAILLAIFGFLGQVTITRICGGTPPGDFPPSQIFGSPPQSKIANFLGNLALLPLLAAIYRKFWPFGLEISWRFCRFWDFIQ